MWGQSINFAQLSIYAAGKAKTYCQPKAFPLRSFAQQLNTFIVSQTSSRFAHQTMKDQQTLQSLVPAEELFCLNIEIFHH